jgi:hypothetical protein
MLYLVTIGEYNNSKWYIYLKYIINIRNTMIILLNNTLWMLLVNIPVTLR